MDKGTKIGIVVIILSLLTIFIVLLTTNKETKVENKISTEWGKTYYNYLKDNGINLDSNNKVHECNINFYEIDGLDSPIMVLEYTKDNKKYSNINYIYEDKIQYMNSEDPATVELLYNKKNKKYAYYMNMVSSENGNFYEDIKSQIINASKEAEDSSRVTSDSHYFSTNSNDKFDDVFKKVDVESKEVKINTKNSNKEIAAAIEKKIKEYKPVKELTNK